MIYSPANTTTISEFARRGIAHIDDNTLRQALDHVYQSSQGVQAASAAQRVFLKLTSCRWSVETTCRFLSGWQSTHGTSLFVSGLVIRLQREARRFRFLNQTSSDEIFEAAAEMGEVIAEDTGVDDIPHHERYVEFANQVAGNDTWQLMKYAMPTCMQFRRYIKERRLTGCVEEAILTTMASENWNTGEYSYFDPLVRPWMIDVLGCNINAAKKAAAYVTVHAGETELTHFLHTVHAWQRYCKAIGKVPDPMKAANVLDDYLGKMQDAFEELEQLFVR